MTPVLSTEHADLEQLARVVPGDELRPDDAGVGAERLLDEGADGVRVEGDVVVAEQVEGGALDDAEHLVGGGAEAGVAVEAADVGRGQDRGDPGGRVLVAAGVDDEDRQGRVVLVAAGTRGVSSNQGPGSWVTTTATTGGSAPAGRSGGGSGSSSGGASTLEPSSTTVGRGYSSPLGGPGTPSGARGGRDIRHIGPQVLATV